MGDLVAKLIAVWLAGLSPDGGAPATFVSNHDGDSLKVSFACTGPVTATISFSGLSLVQAPAGAPPLTLTVPCGKGGVVPMDLRVTGIDTPEIAAHCAREKAKAL